MGSKDIPDKEYIDYLKDETTRIRGLYEQSLREVNTLRLRNKVLQDKIYELMSK